MEMKKITCKNAASAISRSGVIKSRKYYCSRSHEPGDKLFYNDI